MKKLHVYKMSFCFSNVITTCKKKYDFIQPTHEIIDQYHNIGKHRGGKGLSLTHLTSRLLTSILSTGLHINLTVIVTDAIQASINTYCGERCRRSGINYRAEGRGGCVLDIPRCTREIRIHNITLNCKIYLRRASVYLLNKAPCKLGHCNMRKSY